MISNRAAGAATADGHEDVATAIADELADPDEVARRHRPPQWWRQSLASGALAITLLHVQRAHAGDGSWDRVHRWLRVSAGGPIDDGPGSNLHYGAPALGYVLHHAAGATGRYRRALDTLDERVAAITRVRLDTAQHRLDSGRLPALAEFDAIRGLTGLGAYWLHRTRTCGERSPLLAEIGAYLVRLTEPRHHPVLGTSVPGWWTALAPTGRTSDTFPGGHANHGVAHGIAGPLALLALAVRAGVHVDGHRDAIGRVQTWLDRWRATDGHRVWWPYWITPADLAAAPTTVTDAGPGRPSWCYGTPGVARAQHLAALALDQPDRRRTAEAALLGVLDSSRSGIGSNAATLIDATLCHGSAGLLHVVRRAATDITRHADVPRNADVLRRHLPDLRARVTPTHAQRPWGLLEGAAGIALALTADPDPSTGHDHDARWDTCLLTS